MLLADLIRKFLEHGAMLAALVAKLILAHVAHLVRYGPHHGRHRVADPLRDADLMASIHEGPVAPRVLEVDDVEDHFIRVRKFPPLEGAAGPEKLVSILQILRRPNSHLTNLDRL